MKTAGENNYAVGKLGNSNRDFIARSFFKVLPYLSTSKMLSLVLRQISGICTPPLFAYSTHV